jgi:hypothetical protein
MWLLIKVVGAKGLSTHIADAQGKPLCRTNLNAATWKLQERSTQGLIICGNCRRVLEQIDRSA